MFLESAIVRSHFYLGYLLSTVCIIVIVDAGLTLAVLPSYTFCISLARRRFLSTLCLTKPPLNLSPACPAFSKHGSQ